MDESSKGRGLTHLDAEGRARMVDVGGKPVTHRRAVARGAIVLGAEAYRALREQRLAKGDAAAVARLAGIQAAKRTAEWIPLCHSVPLDRVEVELHFDDESRTVRVEGAAAAHWTTGVEMEALVAVSACCLALYDMTKGLDRGARIGPRSNSWRSRVAAAGDGADRRSERHPNRRYTAELRGECMRRTTAVVLLLFVVLVHGSLSAAGLLSRSFQFKPGVTLEIGVDTDGLRLDSVRFRVPESPGGSRLRPGGLVTADVAVSNIGGESRKLGLAVALFDDSGQLVGVASGGSRLTSLRSDRQKTFRLVFDDVNHNVDSASTFQISLEAR